LRQPGKIVRDADIPPRERILDAACELFYSRGIRCVSVDDIAAAANTNKNTLYRHFESKDLLVAEYLRALNDYGRARFMEAVNAHPGDAYEQLRAYIDRVGEDLSHSGVRGCPMANAAVELPQKDHPARAVIEESKKEHCAALINLCRDAGIIEPERLADELFLLFEGACVDVQISGPDGPGANFARVAHALIDLHPRNATSPTA
jgi:AcrR family transcriptional regulator